MGDTQHRLSDFIGDGARADGFEDFTTFIDGIVSQNPTGLSDDEMSYIRLLKIMGVAAMEGANQEFMRHGRPDQCFPRASPVLQGGVLMAPAVKVGVREGAANDG